MDIENIGLGGVGGGLFTGILYMLGIKQRLDRTDKDVKELKDVGVNKETCIATHKAIGEKFETFETNQKERFKSLESKVDILLQRGQ